MSSLLEVQNLVKHFPIAGSRRKVQAINGVSFSIERGETVSLVGESGSGKTTIGRCLLGLIEPTAGGIFFKGQAMGRGVDVRAKALRGRLQMVFQEPAESLNPRMRIGEILGEPLLTLGMSRGDRDRRVAETAALIGLRPALLDVRPADLSAGLQQRVGIGRAIVTRPDLIVLDEPTSALDPTARAEIVDLLKALQADLDTAYLFISHDLSTVRFLSHRVVVLYLGSIAEEGPSDRLFAAPRHPYSAGLLASVMLPHPSLKAERRLTLEGEIPSPIDLPPGCPLATRCPFTESRCRDVSPPPSALGGGHLVHCYNHQKVAALGDVADQLTRFQELASRILA
ncbi:ABC transporter ATP-binding protein [Lichenifustis flavocetrariae]|uniref:ABC transporter ATP-binding protein n=1 Tax=Lichenifustis flavocetrariae TaxID=2949735 RepID=A0AA41YXX2_9HYPH|nr:ABC transporter ATP-binding protein [Lichenifustis flavocetrariae]MCW6510164.1 ABC transporter ATP-binding protein [Lichenifustis flavocetrariae]